MERAIFLTDDWSNPFGPNVVSLYYDDEETDALAIARMVEAYYNNS